MRLLRFFAAILSISNFWLASIKVMLRSFKSWNRERYPGGPPAFALRATDGRPPPSTFAGYRWQAKLPGRPTVGQRPLKARMLVRPQPRQPISISIKDKHQNPDGRMPILYERNIEQSDGAGGRKCPLFPIKCYAVDHCVKHVMLKL